MGNDVPETGVLIVRITTTPSLDRRVPLALFDAAIQTRIDERHNLVVELGRRNVPGCFVGNVKEDVRAKGHAAYEHAPVGMDRLVAD